MVILVTGGAGFIGSNFIYYELDKYAEDRIVCIDALTYAGNLETLEEALKNERFVFYRGDIADGEFVNGVFAKEHPDIVVNFAAESHVDRSIEAPDIFLRTNVIGTMTLLEACRNYGIQRFHQVGTDEVYGDLPLDRTDLFFTEETPIHTSSPYSASKAAADLLVLAYHRTYGLPVTISRCSNNYGPYHFPEKLIPLIILNCLDGKPLPVYGKGANVRDWLYVEDHVKALCLVNEKGKDGETYNVGGHNERTNLEVVQTICSILDELIVKKPLNRLTAQPLNRFEELITYVTDRPGHDLRYAIDPSKLMNELGWKPEENFETGIRKTVQWYLDNEWWWGPIHRNRYSGQRLGKA